MCLRLYNEFKKASLEENRKSFRSSQGTGFVEVAAGFILVLLVIYVALDLFLVAQGCTLNTEIVKEAARVASMGPPGKMAVSKDRVVKEKEPPYVRVMQIIEAKKAALPSAYELTPEIDITETVNSPVPKEPLGGPILGTITVKTTIVVHLQSIASFFKLDQIKLSASSICPYTWVMKSQTTL